MPPPNKSASYPNSNTSRKMVALIKKNMIKEQQHLYFCNQEIPHRLGIYLWQYVEGHLTRLFIRKAGSLVENY